MYKTHTCGDLRAEHIGQTVTLGKLRARVVRHHDNGIAVEFVDIQNPQALRKYFG